PTSDRSKGIENKESRIQVETLEKNCEDFNVTLFPLLDTRQDGVTKFYQIVFLDYFASSELLVAS
ncbi:hypothetical protein OA492_03535, partial [Pelagibacteraceae bacterium]|nr:hypothetical protein [Pelagibacteraceae bacterium]